MKQKVVIIGNGYTSRLAITRSVALIGCEVTLIVMTGYHRFPKRLSTKKPIDAYSKYVSRVLFCFMRGEEELINLLLDECTDSSQKVVIIPDSDFSAKVIDENQERLKDSFLFPHIHNKAGAVVEWMDKVKQKQLAHEIGLNVASSNVVTISKRKYFIPSDITYPCFTKPLATIAGGKKSLRLCNNKDELEDLLNYVGRDGDARILIEDYKQIEHEYAVLGFSNGNEVVIPGLIHIDVMSQSHRGVALHGRVTPVKGWEDLIVKFQKFVLSIGFVGIFDIDFYKSDGNIYFGELNLRFGGSGYAVTKMGVNLPGMLVKTLVGKSIDDMSCLINDSASFTNERTCLDDWYHRLITTDEFHSFIESTDILFVKDDNDSMPYNRFLRFYNFLKIKKSFKSIF